MHNTRGVSVGGVLKQYMRLEEQNPDLIGKDEKNDPVELESLIFKWRRDLKKYNI